jgi:hypothetical protein
MPGRMHAQTSDRSVGSLSLVFACRHYSRLWRERLQERADSLALDKESVRTAPFGGGAVLAIHSQKDDADVRQTLLNAPRRFQTVHIRHLYVHHNEVGVQGLREMNCLFTVNRFTNHMNIGTQFDQFPQALAARLVVVNNQDIHWRKLGIRI